MARKRTTSNRSNAQKNTERRQRYAIARAAGLSREEANRVKSSWGALRRRLGMPEVPTDLLRRRMEGLPAQERYKITYKMLRKAGYSREEARRLRALPPEMIPLASYGKQLAKDKLDHGPMDRAYRPTAEYAYYVWFRLLNEASGEVEEKVWTILTKEPMSLSDLEYTVANIYFESETYGTQYLGISRNPDGTPKIRAMKRGLPGGVV